jgi:hypothetical protein
MRPNEALTVYPLPWSYGKHAHEGHCVYDNNGRGVCEFNKNPAGVALAGVLVELMNNLDRLANA